MTRCWMRSKVALPDSATVDRAQLVAADQVQAGTLAQDGKLLYEMGKLDEAQQKLEAALKLDPDNQGALYYMNLMEQAKYQRETEQHTIDTQTRMAQVEKQWVLPKVLSRTAGSQSLRHQFFDLYRPWTPDHHCQARERTSR